MKEIKVQRNYKDTVFRMLFKEKENSVNPNMPLRDLIYVTKVLQGRIKGENLYGTVLVRIPAPRFVVFYNGTDSCPERQILRLSDAFERQSEKPELELLVTVYNINWGYNPELMKACRLLREYAQYVEQVRTYSKDMPFSDAVETAVEHCIQNGILEEFLTKNRAEAIAMSIFEYNEEQHLKSEKEQAYQNGYKEGESRLANLLRILTDAGRSEDINRITTDQTYREQLYLEYNI